MPRPFPCSVSASVLAWYAITYKHEKAIVGAYMRLYMWLCWSLADDDRRPAPRLRCGGPWPRMQQAGGQAGTRGGVAEKAAASLGMGGEYSHILPRTIPGYRKTWRWVLWNPGRKLSDDCSRLFKISSFYSACFERNLWYFENRQNYTNPCSEVLTMPCGKKKKGGRKGC